MGPAQPIVVRHYRGRLDVAMAAFQADAARARLKGYAPISQVYEPGSWGCGAFLIAAATTVLFGIGILIFAYLLIVKPAGTLAVTYRWQGDASDAMPPPAPVAPADAWQR